MDYFKKKILIKRLLILTLTFTLCFNVFFTKHEKAYAFDFVITPTVLYYLVGTYLVASGVVLAHQNDLMNLVAEAVEDLNDKGEEFKSKIIEFKPRQNPKPDGPKGHFQMTAFGLGWFGAFIDGLKLNTTVNQLNYVPNDGDVTYKFNFKNPPQLYFSQPARIFVSCFVGAGDGYTEDIISVRGGYNSDNSKMQVITKKSDNREFVHGYLKVGQSGTIIVPGGVSVVQTPQKVVENYKESTLNNNLSNTDVGIPFYEGDKPYIDNMIGSDFNTIKDSITMPEPDLNPDPNPEPDPGPDPNPDPGTESPPKGFFASILAFLSNIWDWCTNFIGNLIEALINMLKSIFVPSSQLWQDTYNNLKNTLDSKFAFVGQLGDVFDVFKNYQFKEDIYKIYWPYDKVTDFAWYMPYRMRFRNIMSGLFTVIFVLGITKRNEPQVMVL